MADGSLHVDVVAAPRKWMLPAGRTAELRHLRFDQDMGCWTVRCGCCKQDLPCDEEFYSRDGRGAASWCKACRADKFRKWYRRTGRAQRQARKAGAA